MFAKVAQVQFQALLDACNEHVSRLRVCPEIVEAPKSGYASRDSGAWAGNSWALTRGRGPVMADPVFIRADPIQGAGQSDRISTTSRV